MGRHHGKRWQKKKLHREKIHWRKQHRRRQAVIKAEKKFFSHHSKIAPDKIKPGESKHHCVPRSRGGRSEPNNLRWTKNVQHVAWHVLFANMIPDEVIALLRIKTKADIVGQDQQRVWAWQQVFGETQACEAAIKIVQESWTPLDWIPLDKRGA